KLTCPKCGKIYERGGFYYEKHINSCTGKKPSKKQTKTSVIKPKKIDSSSNILKRLDLIENRLYQLEQDLQILKFGKASKSEIRSEDQFLEIINRKIHELSQKMLGIQKIAIKDLFNAINEDYNISTAIFTSYLLKLYNRNKIQLEAGMSGEDFFIEDNYGNVFKLIRILD
ncbi:MAG: hypothetical protein ACFFDH_23305, partial [Promethearchaeota archaeon]